MRFKDRSIASRVQSYFLTAINYLLSPLFYNGFAFSLIIGHSDIDLGYSNIDLWYSNIDLSHKSPTRYLQKTKLSF